MLTLLYDLAQLKERLLLGVWLQCWAVAVESTSVMREMIGSLRCELVVT